VDHEQHQLGHEQGLHREKQQGQIERHLGDMLGLEQEAQEPRPMIMAVEARKLEAMIQLRSVCNRENVRFSVMMDSTTYAADIW